MSIPKIKLAVILSLYVFSANASTISYSTYAAWHSAAAGLGTEVTATMTAAQGVSGGFNNATGYYENGVRFLGERSNGSFYLYPLNFGFCGGGVDCIYGPTTEAGTSGQNYGRIFSLLDRPSMAVALNFGDYGASNAALNPTNRQDFDYRIALSTGDVFTGTIQAPLTFLGFVSTSPIASVALSILTTAGGGAVDVGGNFPVLDSLRYTSDVPEPSTSLFAAAGIGLLALRRRLRRP